MVVGTEHFSDGWEENANEQFMIPKLRIDALLQCLQECCYQSSVRKEVTIPNIQDYVNALRNKALHQSEIRRQEIHRHVKICQDFMASRMFKEEHYLNSENRKPLSWKECQNNGEISICLREAIVFLIETEHFTEDVPFLMVLKHQPSIGDDCAVLGFALPKCLDEVMTRDLLEVCLHAENEQGRQYCYRKILSEPERYGVNIENQESFKKHLDNLFDDMECKPAKVIHESKRAVNNNFIIHRGDNDNTRTLYKYPAYWINRVKKDVHAVIDSL
jgi:hypothetical protein